MTYSVFIHYRDCRLDNHTALMTAIEESEALMVLGIFDPELQKLPLHSDIPLNERHNLCGQIRALSRLKTLYEEKDLPLTLLCGKTLEIITTLFENKAFEALYFSQSPELIHSESHQAVQFFCQSKGILYRAIEDEKVTLDPVLNSEGKPYKVFTPFYKNWRQKLSLAQTNWIPSEEALKNASFQTFDEIDTYLMPYLQSYEVLSRQISEVSSASTFSYELLLDAWPIFLEERIHTYEDTRDYPALNGTSGLSILLNNGLISYRQVVEESFKIGAEGFLRQLAWREFYKMILKHFPVVVTQSFLESFRDLKWSNEAHLIELWKDGHVGIAFIDAAMKELRKTGHMHNRLRMVCATFLVKNLDVDWRIGESYFYESLCDGDMALNNGGWQWCASTGCDAQPYFRLFNPLSQQEKFDKNADYIKRWLSPEEQQRTPIVDVKLTNKMAKLKYASEKERLRHDDNTMA